MVFFTSLFSDNLGRLIYCFHWYQTFNNLPSLEENSTETSKHKNYYYCIVHTLGFNKQTLRK